MGFGDILLFIIKPNHFLIQILSHKKKNGAIGSIEGCYILSDCCQHAVRGIYVWTVMLIIFRKV